MMIKCMPSLGAYTVHPVHRPWLIRITDMMIKYAIIRGICSTWHIILVCCNAFIMCVECAHGLFWFLLMCYKITCNTSTVLLRTALFDYIYIYIISISISLTVIVGYYPADWSSLSEVTSSAL